MQAFLQRFLRSPWMYIALQRSLGADRLRRICLDEVLKLRAGEHVLDIGCGPGYILEYMPDVDYVGFDTEPRYIDYAKVHYGDRGQFFCEHFGPAHVAKFAPFEAIMLFGVIHHLDDAVAENLLVLLGQCLTESGRIVTVDPCFTPDQSAIARRVAQSDRGRFVREVSRYKQLVSDKFEGLEASIRTNVCRIPSTELIMRFDRPRRPGSA